MSKKTWHTISPPERRRVYVYPTGATCIFHGVTRVGISESGTHYLDLADGKKIIVAPGWRVIELDVDEWTF